MPAFEPIAIVGRACTLPGALSPTELWQNVLEGRDLLGPVPEGRWRVATETVLRDASSSAEDGTWSDRGGYVRGFDQVSDLPNQLPALRGCHGPPRS